MAKAKVSKRYNRNGRPAPPPTPPPVKPTPPPVTKPAPTPASKPISTPTGQAPVPGGIAKPTTGSIGKGGADNDAELKSETLYSGHGQWGLPGNQAFSETWGNYDWGNFNANDFGFSMSDVPDYMRSLMSNPKALVMMMKKKGLLGKKKKKKKLRAPVKK